MKRTYLLPLLLISALLVSSCHKETAKEADQPGAPFEIMVVFAPGQLGDKGYADNVMEGVNALNLFDEIIFWGQGRF